MKIIRTLFFILIALKLEAQSERPKYESRPWYVKPHWDLKLAFGFTDHKIYQAGVLAGVNVRFRNHLYASMDYMVSGKFVDNLFLDDEDIIKDLSLVTGVHYTNRKFYTALGIGLSRIKKDYFDSFTLTHNLTSTYGIELKTEAAITINRYIGLGFSYHYNLNRLKDFQYIVLGVHITLIQ